MILPYFSSLLRHMEFQIAGSEPEPLRKGIRVDRYSGRDFHAGERRKALIHKGAPFQWGFMFGTGWFTEKTDSIQCSSLREICMRIASPIAAETEELKAVRLLQTVRRYIKNTVSAAYGRGVIVRLSDVF